MPLMQALSLADEIDRALDAHAPLARFSTRSDAPDLDVAYDAARLRRQRRAAAGDAVVGRKIGFTNRTIWPRYGVHQPIWGAMYRGSVTQAAAGEGTVSLRGAYEPRIEPEVVLHLASTPEPGESLSALAARIDWVAHGFEIVHSPYPGWQFGAADAVAVGSLHHALLLGPPQPVAALGADWPQALQGLELELRLGDEPRDRGRGDVVLDGPLQALAHLVAVLARRPADEALQAGEIVTTGTLTDAHAVSPGQRWHTRLAGAALPGLTIDFSR